MNKVLLSGRLTNKVELKKSEAGKEYAQFTIAIKKNKDEAEFVEATVFDNTASFICKYGKKGDAIIVEGHVKNNIYEKDGIKQYKLSIIADSLELYSSNKMNDIKE